MNKTSIQKTFPQVFFLLLVTLVTVTFFGLISNFLMAVFWAIVFAILFYNRYTIFSKKFPNKPNLSAALTLLYVILVVVIPLSIIGAAVANEAAEVYKKINESNFNISAQIEEIQDRIPVNETILEKYGLSTEKIKTNLTNALANLTGFVANTAVAATQNIVSLLIDLSLMLYVLFFFLRDGKRLVEQLVWVLPIGDKQEWTLLYRFESVARATVKGSILVALIQGTIGGVLFAILGIPAAFLWGVIMVFASLLPVGSTIIWGPWAVAMFFQGEIGKGLALIAVGAGFIGLIDNLLRPRLVGQDTKMPDYLVLLSTLGGITWFGLSGFVLGPIIAAMFVTCWQMLGQEYGEPISVAITDTKEVADIKEEE